MTPIPRELAWADPRYSREAAIHGTWRRNEPLRLPRPDLDAWAAYATRAVPDCGRSYGYVFSDAEVPFGPPPEMWGILHRGMVTDLHQKAAGARAGIVSVPRFRYWRAHGAFGWGRVKVLAAVLTLPWLAVPEPVVPDPDPEPDPPGLVDPAELLRILGGAGGGGG